ncbi:hypothetical protein PCASD_10142 [Puccinia coronata f. sp. avenae]|uniref:Uncharacterized protein n=1 Tax=Puccinia coronata f. sp. avenae TaxID=200324 RepID=A0A2N5T582_9BASI|nr:hypothetical protein PCASD_17105 [Puccinia coronata f. sp. avenae]PLW41211.1 hypothetical protein PCASD_10142 [Puccinia coronata f. sp. avenae]
MTLFYLLCLLLGVKIVVGAPLPGYNQYENSNEVLSHYETSLTQPASSFNGGENSLKRGRGERQEFSEYPIHPVGLGKSIDEQPIPASSQVQQVKRVRNEHSLPVEHGREHYRSIPSTFHSTNELWNDASVCGGNHAYNNPKKFSNCRENHLGNTQFNSFASSSRISESEQSIHRGNQGHNDWYDPSSFHFNSGMWSHDHVSSGVNQPNAPAETTNYLDNYLGNTQLNSFASCNSIPESSLPAEFGLDLEAMTWLNEVFNPSQDPVLQDTGNEQVHSQQLQEALINQLSHLPQPNEDAQFSNHSVHPDTKILIPNFHEVSTVILPVHLTSTRPICP